MDELTLLDEIVLEQLDKNPKHILLLQEEFDEDELITEVRALKKKVIRDLMLTIRYGNCDPGYRVDSNTKQCVKMSTAELKLFHKLAKRSAKKFRKKGTAAQALKTRKQAKSYAMGKRMNLYKKKV